MSKVKFLLDVVDDLKNLAGSLQAVADAMISSDTQEAEAAPKSSASESMEPVPVKDPPKIGLERVRAVLAEKSQEGKTAQVRKLIGRFGAGKLSEVSPNRYAELLDAAEEL